MAKVKKHSNGTWMYDAGRHPIRKWERPRVSGFRTKAEAEEALALLLAKWRSLKHGIQMAPSHTFVKLNLRDELLRECELLSQTKGEAHNKYEQEAAQTVRHFADFISENMKVHDVTTDTIRQFLANQLSKKKLTRNTLLNYSGRIRYTLRRIKKRYPEQLASFEVPQSDISEFKTTENVPRRIWTDEETLHLIDVLSRPEDFIAGRHKFNHAARNWRDAHDVICIEAMTGMRRTEVMLMERSKIFFNWQMMTVRNLKKKKVSFKEIPLSDELSDLLQTRIAYIRDLHGESEQMLFPRWQREQNTEWLYITLREACQFAGLEYGQKAGFVLHGLRHTAATKMLTNVDNPADIKTAADVLGNTVETMITVYAHSSIQSRRKAVGSLSLVRPARRQKTA